MQRHWNYVAGWRETPRPAMANNDANNSKVHVALDVVGVVTNGAMRDLDMLRLPCRFSPAWCAQPRLRTHRIRGSSRRTRHSGRRGAANAARWRLAMTSV